ncbi:glycerol-3-phosphate dehydrogenase subunit GlpB [Caviibacterium pharyngocola]|uniref:Anaerobic glycerol-3-phosphate dehydrogenase subunit B n=1 Tax=Caviibacterium pharyngocola TaxID=28159 RepID=A0A2M8RXS1_9PAST|nr:glycerol-3-phosphate dehydrogenase subunit GlpB [Caviibacterium pharyngocola]PJG83689.1 anaerobic glycerol-3-phosphate dehydrogenase subunit B [Caviibacterium pharyngocola]
MKFDVAIIGGGLAGLTCGIALQQQGKRCVIVNNGQAAIDFSSGSMDLLTQLPDGKKAESFEQAYEQLERQLPQHPYALIGKARVLEKARRFEQLAQQIKLGLAGDSEHNHLRVTPLGGLRGAWLSAASLPVLAETESAFPYQHIAVLGIEGYHDFQPQLLADNLVQNPQFAHCRVTTAYLHIPELDHLRTNAREFRSVNISQLLEHKLAFGDLVREIKQAAAGAQAVFLPACFGIDDAVFFNNLKQASGLNLYELPTLPPSLLGIRQHKTLRSHFEQAGGLMLNGDKAQSAEFDGNRVSRIFTRLHRKDAIFADHFVLASGSFFSNGLVSDFDRIYEPVFEADIIGAPQFKQDERLSWTAHRFAAPQPYQSAGVAINSACQVQKCGRFIENLYAIGNVIGGYNGLELGCSSGVSVITALVVAENIAAAQG